MEPAKLVTQVEKRFLEGQEQPVMQILVFLVYLGSVVITENNEWRKVLIFHKKKTICIFLQRPACICFP